MRTYYVSVPPARYKTYSVQPGMLTVSSKISANALSVQGNLLKVFQCRVLYALYLSGGSKDLLQAS